MKKMILVICTPESRVEAHHRIGGWSEAPLSPGGLRQLRAIKEVLDREDPKLCQKISCIITSNQFRSQECACFLFQRADVQSLNWRDRNYGWLEGEDCRLKALVQDPETFTGLFQGESDKMLEKRVNQGLEDLRKLATNEDLTSFALITHESPIRILMEIAGKENAEQNRSARCALFSLENGHLQLEKNFEMDD